MIPNPFPPSSGQHPRWAHSVYSKRLLRVASSRRQNPRSWLSGLKEEEHEKHALLQQHDQKYIASGTINVMPWSTDKKSRAKVVRCYASSRYVIFTRPALLESNLLADISSALILQSTMIVRLELNNVTLERNFAGESGLTALFLGVSRSPRLRDFLLCNIGPVRLNECRHLADALKKHFSMYDTLRNIELSGNSAPDQKAMRWLANVCVDSQTLTRLCFHSSCSIPWQDLQLHNEKLPYQLRGENTERDLVIRDHSLRATEIRCVAFGFAARWSDITTMATLSLLDLSNNKIGNKGVSILIDSGLLSRARECSLRNNGITSIGWHALVIYILTITRQQQQQQQNPQRCCLGLINLEYNSVGLQKRRKGGTKVPRVAEAEGHSGGICSPNGTRTNKHKLQIEDWDVNARKFGNRLIELDNRNGFPLRCTFDFGDWNGLAVDDNKWVPLSQPRVRRQKRNVKNKTKRSLIERAYHIHKSKDTASTRTITNRTQINSPTCQSAKQATNSTQSSLDKLNGTKEEGSSKQHTNLDSNIDGPIKAPQSINPSPMVHATLDFTVKSIVSRKLSPALNNERRNAIQIKRVERRKAIQVDRGQREMKRRVTVVKREMSTRATVVKRQRLQRLSTSMKVTHILSSALELQRKEKAALILQRHLRSFHRMGRVLKSVRFFNVVADMAERERFNHVNSVLQVRVNGANDDIDSNDNDSDNAGGETVWVNGLFDVAGVNRDGTLMYMRTHPGNHGTFVLERGKNQNATEQTTTAIAIAHKQHDHNTFIVVDKTTPRANATSVGATSTVAASCWRICYVPDNTVDDGTGNKRGLQVLYFNTKYANALTPPFTGWRLGLNGNETKLTAEHITEAISASDQQQRDCRSVVLCEAGDERANGVYVEMQDDQGVYERIPSNSTDTTDRKTRKPRVSRAVIELLVTASQKEAPPRVLLAKQAHEDQQFWVVMIVPAPLSSRVSPQALYISCQVDNLDPDLPPVSGWFPAEGGGVAPAPVLVQQRNSILSNVNTSSSDSGTNNNDNRNKLVLSQADACEEAALDVEKRRPSLAPEMASEAYHEAVRIVQKAWRDNMLLHIVHTRVALKEVEAIHCVRVKRGCGKRAAAGVYHFSHLDFHVDGSATGAYIRSTDDDDDDDDDDTGEDGQETEQQQKQQENSRNADDLLGKDSSSAPPAVFILHRTMEDTTHAKWLLTMLGDENDDSQTVLYANESAGLSLKPPMRKWQVNGLAGAKSVGDMNEPGGGGGGGEVNVSSAEAAASTYFVGSAGESSTLVQRSWLPPPKLEWLNDDGSRAQDQDKNVMHSSPGVRQSSGYVVLDAGIDYVNGLYGKVGPAKRDTAGVFLLETLQRRFTLRQVLYGDVHLWILLGETGDGLTKHVYYVNAQYGAQVTPPEMSWILGQHGKAPAPIVVFQKRA